MDPIDGRHADFVPQELDTRLLTDIICAFMLASLAVRAVVVLPGPATGPSLRLSLLALLLLGIVHRPGVR
jgi:hypothetical protein